MVPRTRRRLLRTAAAGLSALAGCGGSPHDRDSPSARRRPPNVERDPDTYVLRDSADGPLAWFVRSDDRSTTAAAGTTPGPGTARTRGLVASPETAAMVAFADVDGVAGARRFLDETDFAAETVYLEALQVRECFRLELCYVSWSATEIDTQYGSYYRDADVACSVGATDTSAWLIRVPDALDPDRTRSHGSGWRRNGCHYPPFRRTTTAAAGNGSEVGDDAGEADG